MLFQTILSCFLISLKTITVVGYTDCTFSLTCFSLYSRCPYYVSREIHKAVEILFAPYNYLIDRGNRRSLNLNWENSVLIFDEAHNLVSGRTYAFDLKISFIWKVLKLLNIFFYHFVNVLLEVDYSHNPNMVQESLCADAASFDLSSGLLTACISEAKNCIDLSIKRREQSDKTRNPDNFAILRGKLCWQIVI